MDQGVLSTKMLPQLCVVCWLGAAASLGTGEEGQGAAGRMLWSSDSDLGLGRERVLFNPPSVLTSVQLKAEGLVSLVIWVRVEVALIFLAGVSNEGTTFLLHLAKKLVSYRCSFGFCPAFSCK